jgi:hypothetical protein
MHADPRLTNVIPFRLGPVREFVVRFNGPARVKARDHQDVLRALEAAGIHCADVEIEPVPRA